MPIFRTRSFQAHSATFDHLDALPQQHLRPKSTEPRELLRFVIYLSCTQLHLALLRKIALNLTSVRISQTSRRSRRKRAAENDDYMLRIVARQAYASSLAFSPKQPRNI